MIPKISMHKCVIFKHILLQMYSVVLWCRLLGLHMSVVVLADSVRPWLREQVPVQVCFIESRGRATWRRPLHITTAPYYTEPITEAISNQARQDALILIADAHPFDAEVTSCAHHQT